MMTIFTMYSYANGIVFKTDPATGAISEISIEKDSFNMNWILAPNGKQYKWVTSKYGWGLGFITVNGKKHSWQKPLNTKRLTYQAEDIQIVVDRQLVNGELLEQYTFKNTGKIKASITDCGIYTPWNDNYPSASTCMTNRCNAHIWAGDNAAYVMAIRMGDNGKNEEEGVGNIGLALTEGSISDYEVWERKRENSYSNFRGVFAMDLPDMTLLPGKSYTIAWRIFEHGGKKDFTNKYLAKGGALVSCDKYVYQQGEDVKIYLKKDKLKSLVATTTSINMKDGTAISKPITVKTAKDNRGHYAFFKADKLGEQRIDLLYNKGERTHATILVVSDYIGLIKKRIDFILNNQQLKDPNDARNGAYMVYDNELCSIYKNDDKRKSDDTDEGRERVGMGILLAKWYLKHPNDKLKQSLVNYAKFIREELQTTNYTTYSLAGKKNRNRGYNYAWVADFYFLMYNVTGNKQYAVDGYQTLQALYRNFKYGFYCIDIPVTTGLRTLKDAGLQTEYNDLLIDFSRTADVFIKNGLNFPKSEVNFEQSIVAPATQFLLEMYLQTKDNQYLKAAEKMMPIVDNLSGLQPDYHLHEIPIRHWDCYWFGKRQIFGDTFPHYWSCINAAVYYYYAIATGKENYKDRAKEIVRNNLCNVFEDGTGSCAFVYPGKVNGEKAHFADVFANDQDWALVYYLSVND